MDRTLLDQPLRRRAVLALCVLFVMRCLWLPAHLAFDHHHSPAASASALGFAHGHGHAHGHVHEHSFGFGHDHGAGHGHRHDGDGEVPACPDRPHPHAASDHQPDMRAPRGLQAPSFALEMAPVVETLLPEPEARPASIAPAFEPDRGRQPPPRPPARAPPIA